MRLKEGHWIPTITLEISVSVMLWGDNKLSGATRTGNKDYKLLFGETYREGKM